MSILSHPNIPKPLHGLSPRTILGQQKWDILRKQVYKKYNNVCACCGVKGRLEAHEVYDIDYQKGIATYQEIYALCHYCHAFIHSGLTEKQMKQKQISFQEYKSIIEHGIQILRKQNGKIFVGTKMQCDNYGIDAKGLEVLSVPNNMAKWEDWKLIIKGREFKSEFKSYEEWERKYNR